MRLRVNLLRMLIVDLVLTLFIVFFLQPTRQVPEWEFVVAILVGEAATNIIAYFFRESNVAFLLVQTIFFSAFLSLVLVFWLQPAAPVTVDSAFLYIFVIQVMGSIAATIVLRGSGRPRIH